MCNCICFLCFVYVSHYVRLHRTPSFGSVVRTIPQSLRKNILQTDAHPDGRSMRWLQLAPIAFGCLAARTTTARCVLRTHSLWSHTLYILRYRALAPLHAKVAIYSHHILHPVSRLHRFIHHSETSGTNQVTQTPCFGDFGVRWSGDSKIVEAFAEHDFSFEEAPWNGSHDGAKGRCLCSLT